MKTFFSYRQRSGSRVLASRSTPQIAICEVSAGTICVGEIATIVLYSAIPGKWYRADACRLAEEVVRLVGGLAEDVGGRVTLAIPQEEASRALYLICKCIPEADYADIVSQLWRQGLAEIVGGEGHPIKPKQYVRPACGLACVPGWKTVTTRDEAGQPTGFEKIKALWFVNAAERSGPRDPRVDEPHWVSGGVVKYAAHTAVTSKGGLVVAQLDGVRYESPTHAVAWVQINDPEKIRQALLMLGIVPELYPVADGYLQCGYGDVVQYAPGDEEISPFLQVELAERTQGCWDQLVELASHKNFSDTTPTWAGWEAEICETADAVASA